MAIRWPAKILPMRRRVPQFHHCNDVVPTIYEVVGITPPSVVNGVQQDPIDGVSFMYAFETPNAPGACGHSTSRSWGAGGIYHDGLAGLRFRSPGALGSRSAPGIQEWTPDQDDVGALRPRLGLDPGQRSGEPEPEKLAQMKEKFAIEAAKNSVFPIGGGLWILVFHPELRISTPYREWNFTGDITRMPEFCAPALGNRRT